MAYKHSELTREIINAFYHVYNSLGYGFLEKVYENALAHELRKRGFDVGLILNFGPKPQITRKIYETARRTKN